MNNDKKYTTGFHDNDKNNKNNKGDDNRNNDLNDLVMGGQAAVCHLASRTKVIKKK